MHIVWFTNELSDCLLTTYHEADTVLIHGEVKKEGGPTPSMSIAEMADCRLCERNVETRYNDSKCGHQGKLLAGAARCRENSGS